MQLGHNTVVVALGLALLGASAGGIGAFALARREALTVDAVGHATLPGVAGAFLLGTALGVEARSLPWLLAGAACSAVCGLGALHALVSRTRLAQDAAVGAVIGSFFGVGVVLLGLAQRQPGSEPAGLDRLVFGQAATLGRADAWFLLGLAGLCLLGLGLTRRLLAVTAFSPELAVAQGFSPRRASGVLFGLVGAVCLAGLPTVGMLLVLGLLVLPAAGARLWVERHGAWVLLSALAGASCALLGALLSLRLEAAPTGPSVVLCCAAFLALGLLASPRRGALAVHVRRRRLAERLARAGDAG